MPVPATSELKTAKPEPDFYFAHFEARQPEPPLQDGPMLQSLRQWLLVVALVLGGWYITWRWTASLNWEALWFSIPLVIAETGAYIGLLLFGFNLWKTEDYPRQEAPKSIAECVPEGHGEDRPVKVDVFFATYSEDPELVRLSLNDAKQVRAPNGAMVEIFVLDDGRRESMRRVAEEEGVNYLSRSSNIGFKAGNLRHAMEHTHGDFILICDADTRPFPTILERTLGYFRDPRVAWVQTPQWFYDIPQGRRLPEAWARWGGPLGRGLGRVVEKVMGEIHVGQDPFVNDPKMFYDILMRRRNPYNASFCCGAGSIHRRDAVMQVALKTWTEQVEVEGQQRIKAMQRLTGETSTSPDAERALMQQVAVDEEFTPYKFHVSEDIYTSIVLHADGWKSVMHPDVESKMLSPQDLLTWTIQRFKYAGGTLDIALHDNPLMRTGLNWMQRMMYAATIWSYLGGLWNVVFLVSPLIYLFTAVAPVSAYSMDFYKHILPFIVMTELAFMASYWGISSFQAKANYVSFFPVNLRAIWTVLKGEKIKFPVTPKERQSGNFLRLVWPQASVIVLSILGLIFGWCAYLFFQSDHHFDGLLVNTFWCVHNIWLLHRIVWAAFWQPSDSDD
jgi:cellulose synthase (UDP-forming)